MSDMWGQQQPFRGGSDVQAVALLARYAHRIAKRAILRPTSSPIRDLRAVLASSFYCRPRLLPFDQTSEPLVFEGVDSDGRSVTGNVGAALLRLEFYPVRVLVLDLPVGDLIAAPAQWQDPSDGSTSLNSREAVAAAEAFMMMKEKAEPHLTIHLRNRCAAEPLSEERQKRERRVLNLINLKMTGPAFLRVRSIYVGDRSSHDDLKAEITLTLLQAGIVRRDSEVAEWFCNNYLFHFVPSRARTAADGSAGRIICANAFQSLWKNWGNAEFAQAWRPFVWSHARWAAHRYFQEYATDPSAQAVDADSEAETARLRKEEAQGALSSARKTTLDVRYAVAPVEINASSPRLSIEKVASCLGLRSTRQVYRLVKADRLHPTANNPVEFDRVEVESLRSRYNERRAFHRTRLESIEGLLKLSAGKLKPDSAKRIEYRIRKRRKAQPSIDRKG